MIEYPKNVGNEVSDTDTLPQLKCRTIECQFWPIKLGLTPELAPSSPIHTSDLENKPI